MAVNNGVNAVSGALRKLDAYNAKHFQGKGQARDNYVEYPVPRSMPNTE